MLALAAKGDATMTPAQMEAKIATLIREQQQENQKKRLLRWELGLVVAILIPSLVSVGLMIMGTGEDHPPPMIISLMPLIVILPAVAALVQERKSWVSR
jgi:ABC-type transport system involved in cytochrome bd biosynthesis fused ATPase/permease subunit